MESPPCPNTHGKTQFTLGRSGEGWRAGVHSNTQGGAWLDLHSSTRGWHLAKAGSWAQKGFGSGLGLPPCRAQHEWGGATPSARAGSWELLGTASTVAPAFLTPSLSHLQHPSRGQGRCCAGPLCCRLLASSALSTAWDGYFQSTRSPFCSPVSSSMHTLHLKHTGRARSPP